jgi:predicted acylesterase/phospholipase RssA
MFAVLFAMGILAGELEEYFKDFFQDEKNTSFPVLSSVMSMMDRFGMDSGERLVAPVLHFIKKKYGTTDTVLTFRDLAKRTGINTVVCSTNIHTREPVYFSTDNTPDVSVCDALRASMCVPVMIEPVRIHDHLYVDGAVCDNVPVSGFRVLGQSRVLVVDASQAVPRETLPDTLMNCISIILQIMIDTRNNRARLEELCPKHDILVLERPPIPFMKLDAFDDGTMRIVIHPRDMDEAVAYGYTHTYEFMRDKLPSSPPPPPPPLRHGDNNAREDPDDARKYAHSVLDVCPVLSSDSLIVSGAARIVQILNVPQNGQQ